MGKGPRLFWGDAGGSDPHRGQGKSGRDFGGNELGVRELSALGGGSVDYDLPVPRGDIAPVTPLPNGNAGDVDVRRQRLCVAVPDGVDGGEV